MCYDKKRIPNKTFTFKIGGTKSEKNFKHFAHHGMRFGTWLLRAARKTLTFHFRFAANRYNTDRERGRKQSSNR